MKITFRKRGISTSFIQKTSEKDVPGTLFKSTTENNKGKVFVVFERMKDLNGNYFY